VQAENVELLSRVQQQRKDIAAMVAGLENMVADLDASVAALQPDELDHLRDEVRDVDERMRMEI
jgi:kinetochore protein NNF1